MSEKKSLSESGAGPRARVRQRLTYPPPPRFSTGVYIEAVVVSIRPRLLEREKLVPHQNNFLQCWECPSLSVRHSASSQLWTQDAEELAHDTESRQVKCSRAYFRALLYHRENQVFAGSTSFKA